MGEENEVVSVKDALEKRAAEYSQPQPKNNIFDRPNIL